MSARRAEVQRAHGRALALVGLGLAAGCVGVLPSVAGGADPFALLAWLAFSAPATGFALGASGLSPWPFGVAVPGGWMALLAAVDAGSARDLPEPLWAGLAWSGLFLAGLGLGRRSPREPWRGAGALLLAAGLLSGLCVRGGLGGPAFAERSPALGRVLLDVSPQTLVFECAGVDWMRRPAVYRAAGTDWLSGRRSAYRGSLAGPLTFVVGCAVALASRRRGRRASGHLDGRSAPAAPE